MWNLYTQIGTALLAALVLVVIYQNRKSIPKKGWMSGILAVTAVVLMVVYRESILASGAKAFGAAMSLVPAWATFWQCLAVGLAVASFGVAVVIAATKQAKETLPFLSRIPVVCWFGAVFSALMAAIPYLKHAPGFILLVAALFVFLAVVPTIKVVPEFKAGVVVLGKKPVRSSGSGWVFLFRPLGFAFEDVVKVYSIKDTAVNGIEVTVELGGVGVAATDKEYLKLVFTLEFQPDERNYVTYQSFDPAKLEQTLIGHLQGLSTDAFKGVPSIEEAYKQLEQKEKEILAEFQKIQPRFGVVVKAVTIADTAVDPELLKQKVERQNKLKAAEMEVLIQRQTNKKNGLRLKKIRDEAAKLRKENPELSPKEALESAQVSLEIIKETKQTFDIGGSLKNAVGTVLSMVLNKETPPGKKDPIGF